MTTTGAKLPAEPAATPPAETKTETPEETRERFLREAWQATLGTLNNAEEETQALLGRLVALGQLSREEGTRMFSEVRVLVEQRRNELEDRVQSAIGAAMKRLTIPTQEDLAEVAQKIAELERRVEALDNFEAPSNPQMAVSKLARGLSRQRPRKK
jgi:polyhydroxyalkanoate synthesis regulator phasin